MSGHGPGSHKPVDVFRKALIVGILFTGIILLYNFIAPTHDAVNPSAMLAVGFVILASYTIGELAEVGKLPHITGYLLAGLLLGESAAHTLHDIPAIGPYLWAPFDEGLLNHGVLEQLGPMDTLALALICLTAGGELKLESLKAGLGRILAILGAQTVTIFAGTIALFFAISGAIEPIAFDKFVGLEFTQILALGAVLSSVSLATAPAATIAIINSTGSKGPMTSNVLPVVVLKDVVVVVCFSGATAIAVSTMGASGGGGFGAALMNIAASIVLGGVVGWIIDLYLRRVGVEILLFIVGMVYATSEAATAMTHLIDPHGHPELALVFIAAGFSTSNFSSKGGELIHEVERLSLPVYVVFFTMAGAKLHIDDLIASWWFALALVGVRIAMLYVGVRAGAALSGADTMTRRYGWMGFVSQAGLALTLAGSIQATYGGDVGNGLFSLILAGVALNEVLGPIMLQAALGFAGETAAKRGVEVDHEAEPEAHADPTVEEKRLAWARDDPESATWGLAPQTGDSILDEIAVDLEIELRQLVQDLGRGPLSELQQDAKAYLRVLRRDFLRYHRRITTWRAQHPDSTELTTFLRGQQAELSSRWRDELLGRSKTLVRPTWSPRTLQDAIDQRVSGLPDVQEAPLSPDALVIQPDDGFWTSTSRRWLSLKTRISNVTRTVRVRELAGYHFRGHVAGRMEGLAALIVNAELHLADRTRSLLDTIQHASNQLIEVSNEPGVDAKRIDAGIQAVRTEVDEEFAFALEELGWINEDAVRRTTAILGSALIQFKDDLAHYDTPDLPPRLRQKKRTFNQRTQGLIALSTGLEDARETAAAHYASLALSFEVVGLEGQVQEAVEVQGELLERQIRGKANTQLDRVREGMAALLAAADTLLQPDATKAGTTMASTLRDHASPVDRVLEEAIDSTTSLRDWLSSEDSDAPLLDAILSAAQELTEQYEVPIGPPTRGEWALPTPVPTVEIPFRQVSVSYIEAHITRDVIEVTRRLAGRVDTILQSLLDLQRVVNFNTELATSELDVHGGPIPAETRTLVREMLLGAWGRSTTRLEGLQADVRALPTDAGVEVRQAVLSKMDAFRDQVSDGRIAGLRSSFLREVEAGRRFFDSAGNFSEAVSATRQQVAEQLTVTLGDERIAAMRHTLGLQESEVVADPAAFTAPEPIARLPAVYRRLFSDHALEAGDLLTGREEEYARALDGLRSSHAGMFRSVALVGLDGIGQRVLANALTRGLGAGRLVRHSPTDAVSEKEVAGWFDEPADIRIFTEMHQLFRLKPAGFAPLRRFVNGIVADGGNTSILAVFDTPVWHFANRASGLESVFGEVVRMDPLTADELQTALLARHGMSGYDLEFEAHSDLAWQIQDFLIRSDDTAERHQRAWFRTLHQASGGVMHDALRLWMASVLDVDERQGRITMGPVPQPPVSRLRRLPADSLLTLHSVMGQGWTTAALHADQFRVPEKEAETHLAGLAHAGLLTLEEGRFKVSTHLQAPLINVLGARGWLP